MLCMFRLCILCIVCKCVLDYCHRVPTQLQLNISYIISYHIISYIISYHIIYIIYLYLLESSKMSPPTKYGDNIQSPSTEPHAGGRPTDNGVRPGSPRYAATEYQRRIGKKRKLRCSCAIITGTETWLYACLGISPGINCFSVALLRPVRLRLYGVIKKSLCTWWLPYKKQAKIL
jgi:hypothetical protein